jgi:hypothetical protein
MSEILRRHYELYPYPKYPLFASVRRCDTYALNLDALWSRFNGELPSPDFRRILIAGCGSFAPYPFAVANPDAAITALDLSQRSLKRARLHCLLHGISRVEFLGGDLCEPAQVVAMMRRSRRGSRLRRFFQASHEMRFRAGIADALLHPRVRTYRIDELMEMVSATGLQPLLFAHRAALPDPAEEVARVRRMEAGGESPGNFVLYIGKKVRGPSSPAESIYTLNPCLSQAVSRLRLGPLEIAGRLGHRNEPLEWKARSFLRRFLKPVTGSELAGEALEKAARYVDDLFLMRYHG